MLEKKLWGSKVAIHGAGGMGAYYIDYFLRYGCDVSFYEPRKSVAEKVERNYSGCSCLRYEDQFEMAREADVNVLAVPEEIISQLLEHIGPAFRNGTLVVETCSRKELSLKLLRESTRNRAVGIMGWHNWHSNGVMMTGQHFSIVPSYPRRQTTSLWIPEAQKFAEHFDAIVSTMNPEEHDKKAKIQALTYIMAETSAHSLQALFENYENMVGTPSPVSRLTLDFISRTLKIPQAVIETIYGNVYSREITSAFSSAAKELNIAIENKDVGCLESLVARGKEFFGEEKISESKERASHYLGKNERGLDRLLYYIFRGPENKQLIALTCVMSLAGAETLSRVYQRYENIDIIPASSHLTFDIICNILDTSQKNLKRALFNEESKNMISMFAGVSDQINIAVEKRDWKRIRRILRASRGFFGKERIRRAAERTDRYVGVPFIPMYEL